MVCAVDGTGFDFERRPLHEATVGASDDVSIPAGLLLQYEVGQWAEASSFEDFGVAEEHGVGVFGCAAVPLKAPFHHVTRQADVRGAELLLVVVGGRPVLDPIAQSAAHQRIVE